MGITKDKPDDSRNLREQAEKRAKQQIVEFRKQRGQDTTELVHELRVHQIELEIQNEELRNTQLELAESRNKYCELYDFAPVGYFTLNKEGLVVEANLTGAAFLGEERGNLLKNKFSHFIAPDSQDEFYLHRKQVVESGTRQSCEVKLRRKDGTEFSAQLVSVAVAEQKNKYDQFRMTITDITERKQAEEEMLWKTALLESQVEANLDGVLIVDSNNQKILTNKRLIEMWKVPHHIAEDKDDTALLQYAVSQTKYPEQFLEKVKYLYAHKDETSRDEIAFKNGLVFDRYSSPVIDKSGKYFGRIWTFRDITERKKAEDALRESETRFRTIFEEAIDGLLLADLETKKFYTANPQMCRMLGYSEEEMKRLTISDIHPAESLPKVLEAFAAQVNGDTHLAQELPVRRKDGTVFYADINSSPLRMAGRQYLLGIFHDITERKRAEEAIRVSEAKYRIVADNTYDWEFWLSPEGRFLYTSLSCERITGHKPADFEAEPNLLLRLIHPEDRPWYEAHQRAALEGHQEPEQEFRIVYPDGTQRWIGHVCRPVCNEMGRLLGVRGSNRDITERKRAEEKLQQASTYNRSLIEASPDPLVAIGPDGKITDVNIATETVTGYTRTELVGTDFSDYFTEPKKAQAGYQQVFRDGMVYDYPLEIRHRDGHVTPVLYNASTYRNKAGEVVGAFAAARNITKRKQAEESLQISETRFRELFNNISSGVAVYEAVDDGSDFVFRDFNTAGQRMDKTSREDAVGKRVTEIFPGVKEMGLLAVLRRVWQTGRAEQHPTTLYKDGRISGWRENYVYKLPCGDLVAVYDDITARKTAEDKLQSERNLLRTLIDHIPDKVYVKDKDSRFVVSNKTLNEYWLALGENEIIGKTDFDLFEPAKAQEYFDKEQEIIRTGQAVINQEGYCKNKAGNTSYLLVTKVPLRDSHDNIAGLLGIHRDITERKLAEEKLGQERNLLQTLFDHIPDEVYIKDKDSRMVACNKAVVEYWGLKDKSSIIGKTDFDLFDKGTAQKYFDEEKKVIRMGQSVINIERQCLVRKDKPRWILATKVPLKDNQGNVIGIVGINRDITERKQVEHEILEHQNHLKQLAARLTLTEERERRRIAGEIHDEISQTLAIVNIKLDTLRNSTLLEASAAEIAEISSSVEKVIQETRTLTFELSNPLLYELGLEVAVAEWLNERVQVKHGIATEFQDDGKSKPLDNDMRILLFRNTRELLMNCIKHANAGKVRVGIRKINGSIEIVVEDNGVGFDPAEVRLTAGKKSKFGLFSIRESIENLGGHFIIESKPGAGCKAIMTAPLKDQSHEKEV